MENWKPIPGLPGYEASDLGSIRPTDGEPLRQRPSVTGSGYLVVDARVDGVLMDHNVSYLVAKTWLGMPTKNSDGIIVHGDGDRRNNTPPNMAWFSPDPKARKFFRIGAARPRAGGAPQRTQSRGTAG